MGLFTLTARIIAALGQSPQRFPDSIGYETFSLLGASDRPGPIAFVFSVVTSDVGRMTFHVLVGSAAWIYLAHVLGQRSAYPRVIFLATTLLGVTPQVIRYDVTILSESLSISFAVFACAATVHYTTSPSPRTRALWLAGITLCTLSRPTHIFLALACVLPFAFTFLRSRGRKIAPIGLFFVALLAFATLQIRNSSPMANLNMYTVLSSRVLSDDSRFSWFVANGFPATQEMRSATGYDYAEDLPPDVKAIVNLPTGQQPPALMRAGGVPVAEWVADSGLRTLTKYLVTHPSDTLTHAHSLMSPTLNPPNDDFLPLTNGPMLSRSLFFTWQAWMLLYCVGTTLLLLRQRTRRVGFAMITAFLVTAAVYLATVHTSGIEHPRHASTVAIVVRVLGLTSMALALQRFTSMRDAPDDDNA